MVSGSFVAAFLIGGTTIGIVFSFLAAIFREERTIYIRDTRRNR